MSDTPLTDAECFCDGAPEVRLEIVSAVFARTLERSLARRDALLREALPHLYGIVGTKQTIERIELELGGKND